jgi:hypothetical protein
MVIDQGLSKSARLVNHACELLMTNLTLDNMRVNMEDGRNGVVGCVDG